MKTVEEKEAILLRDELNYDSIGIYTMTLDEDEEYLILSKRMEEEEDMGILLCPTFEMVVEWLDKFGIYISILPTRQSTDIVWFAWEIYYLVDGHLKLYRSGNEKTRQHAYEKAVMEALYWAETKKRTSKK